MSIHKAKAVQVRYGRRIGGCPCVHCVSQGNGPRYSWLPDGWAAVCDTCLESGSDFCESAPTRAVARSLAAQHRSTNGTS